MGLWEFRLDDNESANLVVGGELKVDIFSEGAIVDVTGQSVKVKVLLVLLKGIILHRKMQLMVTLCRIELLDLLVNAKLQVVYLKAKKWLVIWVM